MGLCPVDQKPCCDDLCYGGECLKGGGEMWFKCDVCGKYHDDEDLYGICSDDSEMYDDHDPDDMRDHPTDSVP